MRDLYGREIDYMRISVTERCNLRCVYCMPQDVRDTEEDLLSCDEILRIVQAAAGIGIKHIRLTGGEPLLRPGLPGLVRKLADVEGIETVDLTTNGIMLSEYADELAAAGLRGVNVSLDTTDEAVFARITGCRVLCGAGERPGESMNGSGEKPGPDMSGTGCTGYSAAAVLAGIDRAISVGLTVRINSVLTDINKDSWPGLTELAGDRDIDVRFIELMPIGNGKEHTGVSNIDLEKLITGRYGEPLKTDCESHGNGPARYIRLPDFKGSVGFISAIHEKFCDSCNRIRVTASGLLKTCLCYEPVLDLRSMLRSNKTGEELERAIAGAIMHKPKAHCFETPGLIPESRNMSQIGG